MRYLVNWIKKELNPEKYVKSQTTTSEYFYIHGAKIRIADHFGRDDNDLQILVVKDLFGNNKQYLVKEETYPGFVSVPDVKTLKVVLTTFLFHFKNKNDLQTVKDNIKTASAVKVPDVKELNNIINDKLGIDKEDTQLKLFYSCVKKLRANTEADHSEYSAFGAYMSNVFPQWHYLSAEVKRTSRYILRSGRDFDEYLNIMKLEFPEDRSWIIKSNSELKNQILQYVPEDIRPIVSENEKSDVCDTTKSDMVKHGTLTECGYSILYNRSKDYIDYIKKLDDLYAQGLKNLSKNNTQRLNCWFGSLMAKDTDNRFAKTTDGQKKRFRDMLYELPYDIICTFFNRTMSVNKNNKLIPDVGVLQGYINRFLKLYNIGIIKYPDESDFLTYGNNTEKVNQKNNVDEITENIIEKVSEDNIVKQVEYVVSNNITVDKVRPSIIDIKSSYGYADESFVHIKDIYSTFKTDHLNIIDEVIKTINEKQASTSFEKRKVLDVFAEHYSNIWDRLTNTQKELCAGIITNEKMNLCEADYVINKLFDKDIINWPITEMCRKYISEYCRRIREQRIAA